jgi:hypothetical protein
MRRGAWAEDLARLREAAVDNVIHVSELGRLGVPERTAYRRCQENGPWELLAPATIMLESGTPTRRQRIRAALVHAGPGAVVTGLDASRAHGLRRGDLPAAVHVLVRADRQVRSVPFVLIERTTRLPVPPLFRDDLPVAPIERCVLDVARRTRSRSDIAAILTEPVQRRMVLPDTLVAELDAGCRKGSAAPREVLRAVAQGVRSAAEFDVREWWLDQPELPTSVLFNVRLVAGGRLLGIADVYLEEVGLVLPVDSVEQHFMTPDQVAATEGQHRAYRSAGLHVLGFRPSRTRTDPAGLLRDVLDAIDVAKNLPRTDVEWLPDLPRPMSR